MVTAVDTNVLLDVFLDDPQYGFYRDYFADLNVINSL